MSILKQAEQSMFNGYRVNEIQTIMVDFKLIKVGKLSIKEGLKILVGVIFFSKNECQSKNAKNNRMR
jgi:hypothetical protein